MEENFEPIAVSEEWKQRATALGSQRRANLIMLEEVQKMIAKNMEDTRRMFKALSEEYGFKLIDGLTVDGTEGLIRKPRREER